MLTVIAVSLGIIALRPAAQPAPVDAQADYVMLRKPDGSQQVEGKIVIDRRNGDVWGFPTLSGLCQLTLGAGVLLSRNRCTSANLISRR